MKYQETCDHCGTKLTAYTHHLNRAVVNALVLLVENYAVLKRPINLADDLRITHSQQCNLPKLRYYDLIDKIKQGEWIPTQLGIRFCQNVAGVYSPVATLGNRVLGDHHIAWDTHKTKRKFLTIGLITEVRYKQTEEYAEEKSGQGNLEL